MNEIVKKISQSQERNVTKKATKTVKILLYFKKEGLKKQRIKVKR